MVNFLKEVDMTGLRRQDSGESGRGKGIAFCQITLNDIFERVGAKVKFVVAESGCIKADSIDDADVNAPLEVVQFIKIIDKTVAIDICCINVCSAQALRVQIGIVQK